MDNQTYKRKYQIALEKNLFIEWTAPLPTGDGPRDHVPCHTRVRAKDAVLWQKHVSRRQYPQDLPDAEILLDVIIIQGATILDEKNAQAD